MVSRISIYVLTLLILGCATTEPNHYTCAAKTAGLIFSPGQILWSGDTFGAGELNVDQTDLRLFSGSGLALEINYIEPEAVSIILFFSTSASEVTAVINDSNFNNASFYAWINSGSVSDDVLGPLSGVLTTEYIQQNLDEYVQNITRTTISLNFSSKPIEKSNDGQFYIQFPFTLKPFALDGKTTLIFYKQEFVAAGFNKTFVTLFFDTGNEIVKARCPVQIYL